jgi:type II secretory pathway component PulF
MRNYRATAVDDAGQLVASEVNAPNFDAARAALERDGLRPTALVAEPTQVKGGMLEGEDLADFTTQLAHLAAAGLPLEQGLRLIADDLRRGKLAATVRELAEKLESGLPPDEAVDQMKGRLPGTFGPLLTAGMASGRLPAILLSLGRHHELVGNLRNGLRQALAYPAAMLLALTLVLLFLSLYVFPGLEQTYVGFSNDFGQPALPLLTRVVFWLGYLMPVLAVLIIALLIFAALAPGIARRFKQEARLAESLTFVPLLGPVLRHSLIGRWLDALRIGVEAGMDLPVGIELADAATNSRRLRHDGGVLKTNLSSGEPLAMSANRLRLLPLTVPVALQHAANQGDLPRALSVLSELHYRQAEAKMRRIPLWLTPFLLLLIGTIFGVVLVALQLPLLRMLQGLTTFI